MNGKITNRLKPINKCALNRKGAVTIYEAASPLKVTICCAQVINNTIKVIRRRAYGYRDEEYFSLKIKAAFPGIPR